MSRKEIALSVGGVIATMLFAWLLYRRQEQDALAIAQQQAGTAATAVPSPYEYSGYGNVELPGVSVPTISTSSSIGSTDNQVSSSTATTGNDVSGDTQAETLVSNILSAFQSNNSAYSYQPQTVASMTIPTIDYTSPTSLAGVPTTADQAQAGVSSTASHPIGVTVTPSVPSVSGAH